MTGTTIIIAADITEGERFAETTLGLHDGTGYLVLTPDSAVRAVTGTRVSTIHRTGSPGAWIRPEVRRHLDFRLRYEGSSFAEREQIGRERERTWREASVRR